MAIRLRLADGTDVESDSAQELVQFYHQLTSNGSKAGEPLVKRRGRPPGKPSKPREVGKEPLSENQLKLIRLLLPEQDGLTTKELSMSFDMDPKGLGGLFAGLSIWAKRNGFGSKKDILAKSRRTQNGVKVRTTALTRGFRQLLKEGGVPGYSDK